MPKVLAQWMCWDKEEGGALGTEAGKEVKITGAPQATVSGSCSKGSETNKGC